MEIEVATDGYVSEAGAAGWAFIARFPGGEARRSGALTGAPSHLAEWTAVAEALRWAEAHATMGDLLRLSTDSALVAKGLAKRRPEMSGAAGELRAEARRTLARLAERGIRARVTRVPRARNAEADALAREAATTGASS